MPIPPGWDRLGFTSGRRTYRGNRLVGGVPNSEHLRATAGDFTASQAALRAFFGPGVRILDEGNHRHVSGLTGVPYYGQQGTAGLVNGVDTTAPKGTAMATPLRKPVLPRPDLNTLSPVSIANTEPMQAAMGQVQTDPILANLNLSKKPGVFGKGGAGWAALGALGDALMAYGGMQPFYGPTEARRQEGQADRDFEREKFNEQLQLQRDKMLRPDLPAIADSYQWFQSLPKPQQQSVLTYLDQTQPIAVSTPQGTQRVPRVASGPPPEAVAELRSAISQGDRAAVAEFEQVFGPGSANQYLGAR